MRDSEYYLEKILAQLADAYRRSRKDSGTNVIHRRTALNPEKIYRRGTGENDGDLRKSRRSMMRPGCAESSDSQTTG